MSLRYREIEALRASYGVAISAKLIQQNQMGRESIPTNTKRKLWSQCGGYCQNPSCNRYLFLDNGEETVSLANAAHIIGAGDTGPRSEHKLAEYIEKSSISNLIMLCLDCHKSIDELEKRYSVEEICSWKARHSERISSLFIIPKFTDENKVLQEINDLLEENKLIFDEYGPFSKQATEGSSGDAQKIWKRRCLDTILPNNNRIIALIESNKENFPYPWELYRQTIKYKVHANSFKENCLFDEKVNDYKLFPLGFDHFVKYKLGIHTQDLKARKDEEIEYRDATISKYVQEYLAKHSFIQKMEEWNVAMFEVFLTDGRVLRVFVTNTYYFTEYTFEKILSIDPNINVIICSNPYSTYSEGAKRQCIRSNIGLFMLNEFMGAVRHKGENFLNYLVKKERAERIETFSSKLRDNVRLNDKCKVYLFGSYLRRKVFNDIDIMLVHISNRVNEIEILKNEINNCFSSNNIRLDFTICSEVEFLRMKLIDDNRERVF